MLKACSPLSRRGGARHKYPGARLAGGGEIRGVKARSLLKVFVVFALILGVSTTQIGTVSAARPTDTYFTFVGPLEIELDIDVLPSGVVKITLHRVVWGVDGDWEGEWVHSGFATISPNGAFFAFAKGTFTGSVLGHTGTVDFVIHTHGSWPPGGDFEFKFDKITILGGTGHLANIHGQGTGYEDYLHVRVHFAP